MCASFPRLALFSALKWGTQNGGMSGIGLVLDTLSERS
jgi:hypothetical protein